MNLSSHVPTSSSPSKSPIASKSLGILMAQETQKQDEKKFKIRRSVEFSSATERCIPWPSDARPRGILSLQKRNLGTRVFSNLKLGVFMKKMWRWNRLLIKQLRWNPMHPVNQTAREVQEQQRYDGHTIYTCLQPQFIIWKQFSRSSGISTDENRTTLWMIWTWIWLFGAYFSTPHLKQQFVLNKTMRRITIREESLLNSVGQLFNETIKLISEQKEITGVNTCKFKDSTWMSTSLLCSRAYRITHAKADVFSVTVLCVGKMGHDPIATWKSKIKWYSDHNHFKDMNRIVGMPTEFEWKIFPGITTLGFLEKIQSLMRDRQCEPEHFNDRIILMSMHNDIAWQEKETKKDVNTIHRHLRIILVNSLAVIGLSWCLDQKRHATEPTLTNPTDHGIKLKRKWWQVSQDPVIQYFVPPVPLREENTKQRAWQEV